MNINCVLCNIVVKKKVWNQKYCLDCSIDFARKVRQTKAKVKYNIMKSTRIVLFKTPFNFNGRVGDQVCLYSLRFPSFVRVYNGTNKNKPIGRIHDFRYNGVEVELFNPPICQ